LFQREAGRALVKNVLDDVCNRQQFHLLEANVSWQLRESTVLQWIE
jgi:hypothetical protein